MDTPTCPYCGDLAKLLTGKDVYPWRSDLADKRFWACSPCDARVGLHADGRPLGTLANRALRRMRYYVHNKLDPIWLAHRDKGKARKRTYARLADALGIPVDECHIGQFDLAMCRRAIRAIDLLRDDDKATL